MKNVLVAALALVAIGTAVPVAMSGPVGKATGDVGWTYISPTGPVNAHATFTAQGTTVDAKGQIQYQDDVGAFQGVVDCYQPLSGTAAGFSGTISDSSGQYATDLYFDAVVFDNGTPGTAGPDQIAVETDVVPILCSNLAQSHHPWDVTSGNLVVR